MTTFEGFAEKHGIHISTVRSISRRANSFADWGAGAHHFHITLKTGAGATLWSGEYSMGSAHPVIWARSGFRLPRHARVKPRAPGAPAPVWDTRARAAWARMSEKPDWSGRIKWERDLEHWRIILARFDAVAPIDAADILESLHVDCQSSDSSFDDWAGDYGFDVDSRKAHAAWLACRDTAAQIRSSLGLSAYAEFLEIDGEEPEDLDETQDMLRRRFETEIAPGVVERYGPDDTIALDTAFNDWTDMLCKDGEISEAAYNHCTRDDS